MFGRLVIQQDQEGAVVVEIIREDDKTVLQSSPNSGELKLETPLAQVGPDPIDNYSYYLTCPNRNYD